MPAQYPGNVASKAARPTGQGGFESAFSTPAANFIPLYAENYATKTVGVTDPDWRYGQWTDERAYSGTKALKMGMNRGFPPPTCGGSHYFGNNHSLNENLGLPATVPVGSTMWFRVYFYFASTFSFGYTFNDDAEADQCGKSADMGLSGIKWMNLNSDAPPVEGKLYVKIPSAYRKVEQPTAAAGDPNYPDIRIENEAGGTGFSGTGMPVPLDQWFAMQLGIKVANDNTGWHRLWMDNQLVAEKLNIPTIPPQGTLINSWGIGDYWNSVPWTDGGVGRDDLYIDEMMIAADIPGYGAPTGRDANGNTYIDPALLAGDL